MVVHSLSHRLVNGVINEKRRSVKMMGNLSQCRPKLGATCFQTRLQFLGQTLAKNETNSIRNWNRDALCFSPSRRVSRILKFLWCTTEKTPYYKYKYKTSDVRFGQIS